MSPTVDQATSPETGASGAAAAAPSLSQIALCGTAWMALQTVLSKLASIAAQVVLAWLLAPKDFGLVSLALAWSALPSVVQQIGVREVLVRRGPGYRHWVNAAFWMLLAFGALAAVILAAVSVLAAHQYVGAAAARDEAPGVAAANAAHLRNLILLVAVTAPLTAACSLPVALLERQLRFRFIAGSTFVAAVATSLLSIILAAPPFRMGPYAFVLPMPLVAAARLAVLLWAARPPIRPTPHLRRWRYLIGDSGRLLVAFLFGTCITQGDFMLLGLHYPPEVGGAYFFAFNLSSQTLTLLALTSTNVLFSTLSRLRTQPERQTAAFLAGARALATIGVPVCLMQAALADAGVRTLFAAKWYPAIAVIQVLSIGMAFRMVAWPSTAFLNASGQFSTFTVSQCVGAVLFVGAIFGATLRVNPEHAPIAVAAAAAAYFTLEGPACLFLALRRRGLAGGAAGAVAQVYGRPLLVGLIAGGGAWAAAEGLRLAGAPAAVRLTAGGLLGLGAAAAALARLAPDVLADLRYRLGHAAPPPVEPVAAAAAT